MARKTRPHTLTDIIAARRERVILRGEWLGLLLRAALLALAGWLLVTQVFLIAQNTGVGMFPALKDGDLMIAFRLQGEYAKGDVIAYRAEGQRHVGRIVAGAGDAVAMDAEGTLTVNDAVQTGEILYPTYPRGEGEAYAVTVPEGCVYVLGDYRTQTLDSRDFGPVALDAVEGKVITILRRRGL